MDIKEKTILITGGSSGIGKATAIGLAKLGARVIIATSDEQSAQSAVEDIKRQSGNQKVDYLLMDLASQASVKAAAKEYTDHYRKLDVLINNAGIYRRERSETEDGIETVFAVNYLSHVLLTHLLLPLLLKSPQGRIINVASKHRGIRMNLDDLMQVKHYSPFMALGQTKLAMIIFAKEAAKQLRSTNVTINALHPAVTKPTSLLNEAPSPMRWIISLLGASTEKAARTSIYLASSPEVAKTSGQYFEKCKVKHTEANANNGEFNRKVWEESLRLAKIPNFTGEQLWKLMTK